MGMSEACSHDVASAVMAQYETSELGIPLLIVNSVQVNRCKKCGELSHSIPFPDRLIAAAAVGRAKLSLKLSGSEIKFFRKALGLSAKDLSDRLEVAAETVSRWENDKAPMAPAYEKMLRLMAGINLGAKAPAVDFKPDDVVNMSIRPVRQVGEEVTLGLELVRFKVKAHEPTTDAYTEERRQVA